MKEVEEIEFAWRIEGFMKSRQVIESEKLVSPKSFPAQFRVQVTIGPALDYNPEIYPCKFYLLKCSNERIPRNMYLQAWIDIRDIPTIETDVFALSDRNLLTTCYLQESDPDTQFRFEEHRMFLYRHLNFPMNMVIRFQLLSDSVSLIKQHSCMADLKSLYESKEMTDVTISVGKETLKAHKVILAARSPVFKAAFSNGFLESQTNCIEIPDIDVYTVDCFLKYLYYGDIGNDVSVDTICRIYQLANEKQVVDLREYCSNVIATEISPDNVLQIVVLADLHDDASLKHMAVQYIVQHLQEIMLQNTWREFSENHPALFREVLRLN